MGVLVASFLLLCFHNCLCDKNDTQVSHGVNKVNDSSDVTKDEISQLRQGLITTRKELTKMKNELNMIRNELNMTRNELTTIMTELSDKLEKIEIGNGTKLVAFSAYVTDGIVHPGIDIIQFKGIELNEGGHYNDSIFTCPVAGVYFFSFSLNTYAIRTGSDPITAAQMMRSNNTVLAEVDCYNQAIENFIVVQCSNSVTAQCEAGQQVWIKSADVSTQLFGSADDKRSIFTGFLIQAQ